MGEGGDAKRGVTNSERLDQSIAVECVVDVCR